jgi:hypothetical protein
LIVEVRQLGDGQRQGDAHAAHLQCLAAHRPLEEAMRVSAAFETIKHYRPSQAPAART